MSLRRPSIRRLPVLLLGVVVAGALSGLVGKALSAPSISRVEPAELMVSAARALADPPPVSGDFHTHLDLGLPALPGLEGSEGGLSELPAGDRNLRIWLSHEGIRVSELRATSERALISDGSQVWTWDSENMTARHYRIPGWMQDGSHHLELGPRDEHLLRDWVLELPTYDIYTAARALLKEFQETEVAVTEPQTVAGRDAYILVMAPGDPETLIGRFELAIDAVTRVPLRIEVFPRGATAPAVSAGFADVSFDPIDPSMFAFEAPPGVRVEVVEPPARHRPGWGSGTAHKRDSGDLHRPRLGTHVRKWQEKHPASSLSAGRLQDRLRRAWNRRWLAEHSGARGRPLEGDGWLGNGPPIRRFGSGWSTVTAVLAEDPPATLRGILPFEGTLFSAMLAGSGEGVWIVAGAVDLETLGAVADSLP